MIISKIVKSKTSTSTKEGKQYQAQQLYITPLNSRELEKLQLKDGDTISIGNPSDITKLIENNDVTVNLLKGLYQLMLQKMKPAQKLNEEEGVLLQKINEVIK